MRHFFLAVSSLATEKEISRAERCHFPCLHPKHQTRISLSKSFPQTSVLTPPKAQAGENPLLTETMAESGRQRAPQSSTACPVQDQRLQLPGPRRPGLGVYFFPKKGVSQKL